jgi:hypothetical protein
MPAPGQRMPDVPVCAPGGTRTLHAALRSGRHVLLLPAGTADGSGVPGDLVDLVDVVAVPPGTLAGPVLVRPDGHVAAVSPAGGTAAVRAYLRALTAGAEGGPGVSGRAGWRHAPAHDR